MAKQTIPVDKTENRLSDESYDEWETISTSFGTKIVWGDGPGETASFVGVFTGPRMVPMDTDSDGNVLDSAKAAEFVDANGEKFYCWQGFAIETAIDDKEMDAGDTVRITYVGEQATKRGLNPVKVLQTAQASVTTA